MMYDSKKAAQYWGARIKKNDLQRAVLSLSLPKYLNDAYSSWEFQTLSNKLGKIKNKKIVDIACGGGRITIPLAKMGAKVTGIDISQKMLNYAKTYARRNSCSSNVRFILASAWETGLPSHSFDKVLLLGILEHLPDEYKWLALKEATRLLKNNGTIYMVINNKQSFFLRLVKKWKKPTQKKSGYYSSLMYPRQIISYLRSMNLKIDVINSNLNYSILLHLLDKIKPGTISKRDAVNISNLFQHYINLDLNNSKSKVSKTYTSLEERFADQYFLLVKKR